MRTYLQRNNTNRLYAYFYNAAGNLIDPSSLGSVDIKDPYNNTITTNLTPIKEQTGVYYVEYNFDKDFEPGVYYDVWNNLTLSGISQNRLFSFGVFPNQENEVYLWTRQQTTIKRRLNQNLFNYDRSVYNYPNDILTGRVPMVHIIQGSNWYDTNTGAITNNADSEEISVSGLQTIADVGFAFIDGPRACTNTGKSKLAIIYDRNPNFNYLAYFTFGHVPVTNRGIEIPISGWITQNIPPALDLNGEPLRAWPQPPVASGVGAYWGDYFSDPTPGYTFNKSRIDAQLEVIASGINNNPYKPIAIMFDYFNTQAGGYYVWPGEAAADLDQDGTIYTSDSDEKTAFRDAQVYWVSRARQLMPNILLMPNGRGSWPDAGETQLLSYIHGCALEAFPNTPWKGPAQTMEILYNAYNSSPYQQFKWRTKPIFFTDVIASTNWDTDTKIRPISRAAALLFDSIYMYRAANSTDYTDTRLIDSTWYDWVNQLGDPIGSVTLSGLTSGTHMYYRQFTGGTLKATLNGALSGTNQITSVVIE